MDILRCLAQLSGLLLFVLFSIGVYSYMLETEKEKNESDLLHHRPGHLISVQIFKTKKLQTVN